MKATTRQMLEAETAAARERTELDEWILGLRASRRGTAKVDGWIRTVRRATGIPAKEVAQKMGTDLRSFFQLERSEQEGRIGLGKLREAADALGCELVYGMIPKRGTLEEMAEERWETRARAREERRRSARLQRRLKGDAALAQMMGEDVAGYVFRRALKKSLREAGIRLR